MSATLLVSKLHVPGLRSEIMPRRRLSEAVATCGTPVVSIVAPPGFGKTMVLAQWEQLDERPFAWVSLDRRDNDPLVLWNYLVAAIRRVEPSFGVAVEPALGSAGGVMLEAIIPRILNELASIEREIVLVLDTQEVPLRAGEIVVQRGTHHAWSNRSARPAVVAIASHDGRL